VSLSLVGVYTRPLLVPSTTPVRALLAPVFLKRPGNGNTHSTMAFIHTSYRVRFRGRVIYFV
jgi:hypothetical protein